MENESCVCTACRRTLNTNGPHHCCEAHMLRVSLFMQRNVIPFCSEVFGDDYNFYCLITKEKI